MLKSLVHGYQPENPVVDWVHLAQNPLATDANLT
jgi:hypothetical protein